jgi:hypothetical protein
MRKIIVIYVILACERTRIGSGTVFQPCISAECVTSERYMAVKYWGNDYQCSIDLRRALRQRVVLDIVGICNKKPIFFSKGDCYRWSKDSFWEREDQGIVI